MNFLLELPEGTRPVDSLTLALWGSFWTSGLQNCKTILSCCFRPLFVVIFYINNRKLIHFSKQEEENQVKMSVQARNGMRLTPVTSPLLITLTSGETMQSVIKTCVPLTPKGREGGSWVTEDSMLGSVARVLSWLCQPLAVWILGKALYFSQLLKMSRLLRSSSKILITMCWDKSSYKLRLGKMLSPSKKILKHTLCILFLLFFYANRFLRLPGEASQRYTLGNHPSARNSNAY